MTRPPWPGSGRGVRPPPVRIAGHAVDTLERRPATDRPGAVLEMVSRYYWCDVRDAGLPQRLDDYERETRPPAGVGAGRRGPAGLSPCARSDDALPWTSRELAVMEWLHTRTSGRPGVSSLIRVGHRLTTMGRPRVRAPELVGRGGWLNTGGRDLSLADLRGKIVPARLLDVLLRQLPARPRRAAAARGEVRRRPRDGRASTRRSSSTRQTTRPSIAAVERYDVHHPVLDDPGTHHVAAVRRARVADPHRRRSGGVRRRADERRGARPRARHA